MALILLGFEHLPVLRDTRRANAMRHQNSVLHGLLKLVPWSVFERLVDEHRADARIRQLSTKSQFVAMLLDRGSSGKNALRRSSLCLMNWVARS